MTDRTALREAFIERCGWADAEIESFPADFSLRNYFRLHRSGKSVIVMDAPPEKGEDVRAFVRIDRHLIRLGLSAPEIHVVDEARGFLLLEDFGDATFTRLLAEGRDERELYHLAVDSIIALQSAPDVMDVDTTSYMPHVVADLEWLLQWYVPEKLGHPAPDECRARFYQAWDKVLSAMPPPETTLMLRDYHVGNLMLLPDRTGVASCGLLDFQAAEFAPRPYDLVCLLNDNRRDMSDELTQELIERYAAALPIGDSFQAWYAVFTVQRMMRVVGNIHRQAGLHGRLQHKAYLPRAHKLLEQGLAHPMLAPVNDWLDDWIK
jgi:aminoglycoside/choline kinase family phosphotransferase